MRQSIVTKALGPTTTRSLRVKATAAAGSVTTDWEGELDVEQNHQRAADKLADKYGWRARGERYVGGGLPGGGYAFVQVEDKAGV